LPRFEAFLVSRVWRGYMYSMLYITRKQKMLELEQCVCQLQIVVCISDSRCFMNLYPRPPPELCPCTSLEPFVLRIACARPTSKHWLPHSWYDTNLYIPILLARGKGEDERHDVGLIKLNEKSVLYILFSSYDIFHMTTRVFPVSVG